MTYIPKAFDVLPANWKGQPKDPDRLWNAVQDLVIQARKSVGAAALFPAGFSMAEYWPADGSALPADAVDAIAIWGANAPTLTAPAGTSYQIRIYL